MTTFRLWAIIAAIGVFLASVTGAYFKGGHDRANALEAAAAREERIAQVAYEAGQKGAAEAIAKIEVRHTTIKQRAEVITRETPVYRDCASSPDLVGLLNAARANQSPDVSADHPKLPGVNTGSAR